jgi:Ca2+-binding EF-hand superfamily protein
LFSGNTEPQPVSCNGNGCTSISSVKADHLSIIPSGLVKTRRANQNAEQGFDTDKDGVVTGVELLSGFDLNKDKKVSFDEFKGVINKFKKNNLKKIFDCYDDNKDGFIDAKELLQEFDVNKDGKVSLDEFTRVMSKFKALSPEECKGKFDSLDKNKNGSLDASELLAEFDLNKDNKISFDEFTKVVEKFKTSDAALKKIFDSYDKNKDGHLDAAELLAEFDLNKDGKVSFDEFKKVWVKFH